MSHSEVHEFITMPDMILRNLSEELMKEIRVRAAQDGVTMKAWCIGAFKAELHGGDVTGSLEELKAVAREKLGKVVIGEGERGGGEDFGKVVVNGGRQAVEKVSQPLAGGIRGSVTEASQMREMEHNPKTCRAYLCGMCRVLGVKDANRGLR